jgi:L-asparagine transporter-like permease
VSPYTSRLHLLEYYDRVVLEPKLMISACVCSRMGIMLINVTQALGEMAIVYPVSGGFYTLAVRFLDPSWGFAMVSRSLSSVLTFPANRV